MAGFTAECGVLTDEWKGTQVVVEADAALPCAAVVTATAVFT
jgi:hypothetical protein